MSEKLNKGFDSIEKFILDIISAGLSNDLAKTELAALSLARSLKKENPSIAQKINNVLATFSLSGGAAIRRAGGAPLPVDNETQLEMATVEAPSEILASPIFSVLIEDRVKTFLEERENIEVLLEKNIRPSTSLLLIGPPGTGKTMLARYIASQLNKNLVILDLSSSISSLMGKTGANLKKVLQYAKQNPCILLFDEFDAIAKKRDDNTDLGEIKRVVNVLLMELEDWPISSIFIATSNHPELLDRAIWRRFDHTIEISLPQKDQVADILNKELNGFFTEYNCDSAILSPIATLLDGKSAADICKFSTNVKRRVVLKNESPIVSCLNELELYLSDKKIRGKFCTLAKEALGDAITVREIAEITGLSPAGVQHHISKLKS
ncbi:MAG: ATP-binding protein [Sporocytophaga sp.]|nr:ATP-binding protein [Sporocytophaga sp.]